jgi:hypothetical protein
MKTSQTQYNTQIDEGLLCEIDETKRTFSLQKLVMVPLLIIATIICGYFALPTTRTVAITKSVEQVKEGYVTKNIEDIKIGDEVFACDVVTGEVAKRKVTKTFERTSDHLRYLVVCDSKGTQVFETTDSHPFWVVTDKPDLSRVAHETVEDNGAILHHENIAVTERGHYVEAKNLKAGDVFLGANGEFSILILTERVEFPEGITVYNFTVEDNHNYFVIAQAAEYGQSCILVHNADCDLVGHHTIPKQIQKSLPATIASDPKIRGVKGLPNIKYIPEWLHKAIHRGGGNGGAYNARFFSEIKDATKNNNPLTVKEVLRIRDMLVKEFGL